MKLKEVHTVIGIGLEDYLTPEDMPMCPLCGNPIENWEPASFIAAHGCIAAAHDMCLNDIEEET